MGRSPSNYFDRLITHHLLPFMVSHLLFQITGKAPTIQLDSTDSGQIYLSKDCLDVEITTAKCSSINISLPVQGEEEGVFDEHPVPEMFRTTIVAGKLVTTAVEHAG